MTKLQGGAGLSIELLRSGALFALRHGKTLINQLLPGTAENGLFRLLLRWKDESNGSSGWASLVGAGGQMRVGEPAAAAWKSTVDEGLRCTTLLRLHPTMSAWVWHVTVRNGGPSPHRLDVLYAQDLGLADEPAVRNNEAYTSQYIDLLPVPDDSWGWAILARQNQPMAGGRRPWLACTCLQGVEAYCTDGWQFFGADHRLSGKPAAVRSPRLPSRKLQYEFALAGLQSRSRVVAPGETADFVFLSRFVADHPDASTAEDLELLRAVAGDFPAPAPVRIGPAIVETASSLFVTARWVHGERPRPADWDMWFPGERRHEETGADGALLAFFQDEAAHVVSRDKESDLARPHGHILRSGTATWIDDRQFGLTCYAAGIFAAQVYLGNSSFARLLPVARNALGIMRGSGQRIFVRDGGRWQQLGVPSAFAMTPGDARWIYRIGRDVIEVRVWCSPERAASFLDVHVTAGEPREFLISHELVLGTMEFEHGGQVVPHDEEGWLAALPAATSLVGTRQPGVAFAVAAADPATVASLGGDEALYDDEARRDGGYAMIRTRPMRRGGVILLGVLDGPKALPPAVAAARAEFAGEARAAEPRPFPLRMRHPSDKGVARIGEVLPWFNHNAAIHFSAPHGLEQYGGAAWGVRDVCQGSLEWLLASQQLPAVRRMLEVVFAQQYVTDGTWPQWFMHAPYRFIQQAHSHGDVCFWPVKALCDYVEASNDFDILEEKVGYTEPERFASADPAETFWTHCDRVVAHTEGRFVRDTALVNYGDGDWDDTLQPADPAMRTRMISAWTVALAYHTFRQLSAVARRAGESARAERLDELLARMRRDFGAKLMPGGIVAGFLVLDEEGERPLLHPTDQRTGIRYRLLPMTRAILAELFTPEQARHHLAIVERELRYPDGVRLMSEPSPYHGGLERWFKRADTAANVGREIGLQYVHAHLRYAEAMAKVGDAPALWRALEVVNPVSLREVLASAAPRQSNVYFSSSDADFPDRYEARARWEELRSGQVAVRGGWRLYSSGPGLFLHKVRTSLLGLRESFGDYVFDPVLPPQLDGLVVSTEIAGRGVTINYHVRGDGAAVRALALNGTPLEAAAVEANPYRPGGWRVAGAALRERLLPRGNELHITC